MKSFLRFLFLTRCAKNNIDKLFFGNRIRTQFNQLLNHMENNATAPRYETSYESKEGLPPHSKKGRQGEAQTYINAMQNFMENVGNTVLAQRCFSQFIHKIRSANNNHEETRSLIVKGIEILTKMSGPNIVEMLNLLQTIPEERQEDLIRTIVQIGEMHNTLNSPKSTEEVYALSLMEQISQGVRYDTGSIIPFKQAS